MLKFKEEKLEFEWKEKAYSLRFPLVGESEGLLQKIGSGNLQTDDIYSFFELCGLKKEELDSLQSNHVAELLAILTGQKKTK